MKSNRRLVRCARGMQPYEVVFTSKRTRANYQLYLDAMAKAAAEEETGN